jgi:threonine-phosphate decarboxylase
MRCYEHGGDVYSKPEVRLDFSVNLNPLGMPDRARQAVASRDFSAYPDPRCRELRGALSRRYGVPPEWILCGNGASDLILRICLALKPRTALTFSPTFSEYGRSVRLSGGSTEVYAAGKRADAVFLCNPNNPTGRLSEESELLAALGSGGHVIVDECFIEFTEGRSLVPRLAENPRIMVLNAFTKTYAMAGLRLGYLICSDAELLERIAEYGAAWSVSAAAQAAGTAVLGEVGWLERTRELVRLEREFTANALREIAEGRGLYAYPSDCNFMLIRSETPLYAPLLERGVLVRDCSNFAGLDKRYIRIGLKRREQNIELITAIREILTDG